MTNQTVVTQTYYIDSGRKNAMYTLRVSRTGGMYTNDNYICNLSTDPDKAEAKAREYYDRMAERLTENEYFKMYFAGYADFDLFVRRGKLSVAYTEQIEMAERGIMPFGKHKDKVIADLPMFTVLWWADQAKDCNESASQSPVFQAVCSVCAGIALEKDYITKRAVIQQERIEKEARSNYVGEPKQRLEFTGTVEMVISLGVTQVSYNSWSEKFMTKIRCGDNVLVYFGKNIAEVNSEIKFKATVKEHSDYNGTKQTIVQRVTIQ